MAGQRSVNRRNGWNPNRSPATNAAAPEPVQYQASAYIPTADSHSMSSETTLWASTGSPVIAYGMAPRSALA